MNTIMTIGEGGLRMYQRIIALFLFTVFSMMALPAVQAQSGNSAQARAYYFVAEEAYENKNYTDALSSLKKAEELRGRTDARFLALEVKILVGLRRYGDAKTKLDKFYNSGPSVKLEREMAPILVAIDKNIEKEKQRKIAEEQARLERERKAIARQKAAEQRRLQRLEEERIAAEKKRIEEEKKRIAAEKVAAMWRRSAERGQSAEVVWQKTYDSDQVDQLYDVLIARDGGAIFSGFSRSLKKTQRAWVFKLDADGKRVWQYIDKNKTSFITDAVWAHDGGYVLGGAKWDGDLDSYLVKISEKGKRVWARTPRNAVGRDYIASVKALTLADGRQAYSYAAEINMVKGKAGFGYGALDKKGKHIGYHKGIYGRPGRLNSPSNHIHLSDGTPLIVGKESGKRSSNYKAYFLKLPAQSLASGTTSTQVSHGGDGEDVVTDAVQTPDGKIVFIGQNGSQANKGAQLWIGQLAPDLSISWEKFYGGNGYSSGRSIIMLPDGNFLVAGHTNRHIASDRNGQLPKDLWLLKIDTTGTPIWDVTIPDIHDEELNDIALLPDGHVIIAATKKISSADRDVLMMKVKLADEIDQ